MTARFGGDRVSRRDAIRATGGALAAGLTGLAGCRGLPPLGASIRYGSVDVPAAREPTYREWLPAPSALPDGSEASDGYSVMMHAPPSDDASSWARTSASRGIIAAFADYVGVHVDDVDVAVSVGDGSDAAAALVGAVDRSVVRETIGQTPYESDGSYAGYDVYARTDLERVVAVGSDGLVFGNGASAREVARAVVDAGRGEVPRYHERDGNVATLTSSAGRRRWAWLWMGGVGSTSSDGILEDTVGWATAFDHDGDGAYHVQTWVFPRDYRLTEGKVKESLKGNARAGLPDATEASAVDVTVDGRVATVTMYLGPAYVSEELADDAFRTPFVTWRATYDSEANRITFHHEAGDPVPSDRLYVRGGGLHVSAASAGDVGERVEPGESFTVSTADADFGTDTDDEVTLVVESADGDQSAAIFTYPLT